MLDKISITKDNGTKVDAEVISAFEIPDFGRKYIIYTFNEPDPNGLARLSVSQLVEADGNYQLKSIETEDEWVRIKEVMRDIIKGEMASFNFISLNQNATFSAKAADAPKLIAVPNDSKAQMKIASKPKEPTPVVNNEVATVAASVEAPAALNVESPQPVVDNQEVKPFVAETPQPAVEPNVLEVAQFQAPPKELAPDTPISPIVQPIDLSQQPAVEQLNETVAPTSVSPSPQTTAQMPEQQVNPIQSTDNIQPNLSDKLSDEDLINKIENLLNEANIDEAIKKQILYSTQQALVNNNIMQQMKNAATEMANLASTTAALARATAPGQPNTQSPTL